MVTIPVDEQVKFCNGVEVFEVKDLREFAAILNKSPKDKEHFTASAEEYIAAVDKLEDADDEEFETEEAVRRGLEWLKSF